jgi:hypothetical protein
VKGCGKHVPFVAPVLYSEITNVGWWDYIRIASRGCLMVTLVASNTVLLAHDKLLPAAIGGWAISVLWWANSSKHRPEAPYGALAYGFGAAVGTVTGAVLARLV